MKTKRQNSLLKWASLLTGHQIISIVDIENIDILIKILNVLQPQTFQELQDIVLRATNSMSSILKFINTYYKKQLNCNVSSLIQNLNIFKTPLLVWELLIGVAIKGKNRDTNINVILQMELEEQSELMLLVQDVIEKLSSYEIKQPHKNSSQLSESSDNGEIRDRKKTIVPNLNSKANQFLNQIVDQNEALKEKIHELQTEVSHLKSMQQQLKKAYEDRLNNFKAQRYQFLEVITRGSDNIQDSHPQNKSQFNFRQSLRSHDTKSFDDPLHDLHISITGSLQEVATDMLNAISNLKKEVALQVQKSSLLEDHNKDLKLSLNRLIEENKILKEQLKKSSKLQKELKAVRQQNDELLRNQTELIKMMSEVQEQKLFLRGTVQKLKEQKTQLTHTFNKKAEFLLFSAQNQNQKQNFKQKSPGISSNNTHEHSQGSTQKIDIMRAPSMLLRQMGSSQLQPETCNLNLEIDDIKNPLIRQKYEKEILELNEKNSLLRQQNSELKRLNKMLQKTIHKSMQKSQQIQKNIQEGYNALFGIESSEIQASQIQKNQEKQYPDPSVEIPVSNKKNQNGNERIEQHPNQSQQNKIKEQIKRNEEKKRQQDKKNSKVVLFYGHVKKIIESYEQQQLLMIIQIESLKKQLNDLINQKMKYSQPQKNENNPVSQSQKTKAPQKPKKQMKIRQNVIQQKVQSYQHIRTQTKQVEIDQGKIMSYTQNQQIDLKQNSLKVVDRDQSVVTFSINVSGLGEQIQKAIESKKPKIQQKPIIDQNGSVPQSFVEMKKKRNNELYPSEEFIEIQEGEDFNQNDIPFIRKSHQNSQNSIQDNNKKSQAHQSDNNSQLQDRPEALHTDLNNNLRQLSMLSGIGDRFSRDFRKNHFAQSGFYNESFIELSNKLQLQIQNDINEISKQLYQKRKHESVHPQLGEHKQERKLQEQSITVNLEQNRELMDKLQRIKQSYGKIQQFHINSSAQLQSQLNQQLAIQKSEVVQLKIMNESLKQSLTSMIAQKQSTMTKMKQLKEIIRNINSNKQIQELSQKFSQMFDNISELQLIMPQLQVYMEGSKAKELQILYAKQKFQKQQLEQEITILMETIVYFRNLAIDEDYE